MHDGRVARPAHFLANMVGWPMFAYTMIDSHEKLDALLAQWRADGITSVAMDFEGEFNLHVYGEHLCLIQLFDNTAYYLVDPFKIDRDGLSRLLESKDIEKLMFDCASDAALVRKQYGITLQRVHDVRISAQLLGFNGNLTSLVSTYLGKEPATGKKGNQTANWLKRPIASKLIAYALSDVEHLFALREVLDKEIAVAGLSGKDSQMQKTAALPKGPDRPGYEKLSGWKYLSASERIYLKWFFEARDMLAKRLNLPAFRVLDKRVLVDIAKQVPQTPEDFRKVAHHADTRIAEDLLALLVVARDGALQELEGLL